MKRILFVLAVVVLAITSARANVYLKPGDSLTATIDYQKKGTTVYTSLSNPNKPSQGVYIGYADITVETLNSTDIADYTVRGFCIDLFDGLDDGAFLVEATADAPVDMAGGMGGDKALLLGRLFAYKYDEIGTGPLNAAFQLAVWEIVYEDSGALSLSDGDGDFYVTLVSDSDFVTKANDWLAYVADLTNVIAPMGNIALVSTDIQDWVIPNVPAPGALLLGSLGVGLVGWLRRRRAV